jgi:sulfur carrier protein
MEITVNQQSISVSQGCSIQQMLASAILQPANGIAIAVNQEIISKANWDSYALQPGDNITVIKATQGG